MAQIQFWSPGNKEAGKEHVYIHCSPLFILQARLTTHKYFQFCLHSMRIARFVLLLKLNTSKET